MVNLWFSSDPHFHHANIIEYCSRPFKDVKEMNDFIVEQHNKLVKPQDHWYCLGDVTMMRGSKTHGLELLKQMNGHKRLIMGNHDHYSTQQYLYFFEKVMAMNRFDRILFTHIPIHPSSMGNNIANVHGHIHNNQPTSFPPVFQVKENGEVLCKPYVNISLEVTEYRPLHLEDIKARIKAATEQEL